MTAIKVNSFLWNALSDEDKKSIESYFNPDKLDDFSISPDQEFPIPGSESIIYSLTEKELHELTENEIKCRLKYIRETSVDIHCFVSRYNDAALLVCLGILSEKYKKYIDNDAISCVEITEDEGKYYDELLREFSEKKEQVRDEFKEICKVTTGDIATMKLFNNIKNTCMCSANYNLISIFKVDASCLFNGKCKKGNSYPCSSCG